MVFMQQIWFRTTGIKLIVWLFYRNFWGEAIEFRRKNSNIALIVCRVFYKLAPHEKSRFLKVRDLRVFYEELGNFQIQQEIRDPIELETFIDTIRFYNGVDMEAKRLAIFTAVLIFFFSLSNNLYAEFLSLSVGMPVRQSFTDMEIDYSNIYSADTKMKADGIPSGALIHVNIPFFPGLGIELYETKLKTDSGYDFEQGAGDTKLKTVMYDLFYLLPISGVNITIGGGLGKVELDCSECSDWFKKGDSRQYFLQIGIPILAVFDVHFSYHAISSDIDSNITTIKDLSFNSTMYAIGAAFVF